MTLAHIATAIAGAILIALALEFAIRHFKRHLEHDRERIELAKESLSDHQKAVSTLLDRPDIDRIIRKFLIDFSADVLDRKRASAFLRVFFAASREEVESEDSYPELSRSLEAFERRDPKGAELIDAAITEGIVAMIMQWPEHTQRMLAKMATEGARDPSRAARAIHRSRVTREPAWAN